MLEYCFHQSSVVFCNSANIRKALIAMSRPGEAESLLRGRV